MAEIIEIRAKLDRIIFSKNGTSFIIGSFETEEYEFVAKGDLPFPSEGKVYNLEGNFVMDKKYGEQFNIIKGVEAIPETKSDIEALLASGAIKGVGPKTAKLIVSRFGDKTLEIIEESPERLTEISGIGEKKAKEIFDSFILHIEYAHTSLKLQEIGVEPKYIMAIYNVYGSDSVEEVKKNPYSLVSDVFGIGFNKAEEIARMTGYPEDSSNRIEAAITFCLRQEMVKGHTFLPSEDLLNIVGNAIDVSRDRVREIVNEMAVFGTIKIDMIGGLELVYPWENYKAEQKISGKLVEILRAQKKPLGIDIEEAVAQVERSVRITLSEEQREGILAALSNNITIITGGPGTGKTTIINTILKVLEQAGKTVSLAAPTGRAAKRMTESSGKSALTIHRLLEFQPIDDGFGMAFARNEEDPLQEDCIIIDEASMIDLFLMEGLAKALQKGTRVIMVGDTDQLPPVGVGSILQDILDSECFPQVRLKEIFRQAKESQIIISAHAVNKGEMVTENKKDGDFFFMEKREEAALATVLDLAKNRLPSFLPNCDPPTDIQILTPMKKGKLGTKNLNKELQDIWNPKHEDERDFVFGEKVFRNGDKVIQMKNNYDITYRVFANSKLAMPKDNGIIEGQGVFNGDMGFVTHNDQASGTITVLFDGEKYVTYEGEEIEQLELAYALTVHKSQGSEFRAVVMPLMGIPRMLATRNLLYTGITRGKELVTLVGDKRLLYNMIENKIDHERNSSLDLRVKRIVMDEVFG